MKLRLPRLMSAFALAAAVAVGATSPASALPAGSSDPLAGAPLPDLAAPYCAANIVVNIPGGGNSNGVVPHNLPHGAFTRDVGVAMRTSNAGRVADRYASYDSIPGGRFTYEQTRARGYQVVRDLIAQDAMLCPNAHFSLFGYSLGADIASRLVRDIAAGRGPIPESRLSSAVFMANPNRGVPGVQQQGGAGAQEGAFGALEGGYGALTSRVMDVCRPGDIVCDTPTAASPVAKALAKAAILSITNNLGPALDKFHTLDLQTQMMALPILINGSAIHNDYYSVGGPVIATRYLSAHLA